VSREAIASCGWLLSLESEPDTCETHANRGWLLSLGTLCSYCLT